MRLEARRVITREWGLDPTPKELRAIVQLAHATSVGPMMYAVVSHGSWDDLTDGERLSSVRALGLSAQNEGYESVYLVDESNEQLATWTVSDGAKLVSLPR